MKTRKAIFDRNPTSDDAQSTHQPPFGDRLMATRAWLIEDHKRGELDWKDTIEAIERTLNDMGIRYE